MGIGRRTMIAGLGSLALTACGAPRAVAPAARPATEQPLPMVVDPGWQAWVAGFRGRAQAAGISARTLDAGFAGMGFVPGVIERDRAQTEFTRSFEDYLSLVAGEDQVRNGRAALSQQGGRLQAIAARHGVAPHVVAAIWGVETRYGARRGAIPVIAATSTLAYDGRRGAFFEAQLVAALRILQSGDTTPARLTGSWAGAMGHTQFIPTTYQAHAVDFDGDGRRDIWSDDPVDALASAAAYLADMGWTPGAPWGQEVIVPPAAAQEGTRSIADWAALGVRGAAAALPSGGSGRLVLPAGPSGPAFLTYGNYRVLGRYNAAQSYMLSVGILSDRLRGGGPLVGQFGPDANGMTRADRVALQEALNAAGFDAGTPDGVIGRRSIAAIEAAEARLRLPVTGRPSLDLLRRLR